MRILFLLAMWLMSYTTFIKNDKGLEELLKESVRNNNFFQVSTLLKNAKGKLPEATYLYYLAHCENKFDQCNSSNHHIATLLSKYQRNLDDTMIASLLGVKVSNCIRLYQYRQAAATCTEIISNFHKQLDSADIKSYQNAFQLFGALSEVPAQQMILKKDETIAAYRNKFNHLMVPVSSRADSAEFIFDSGAGLSTVSESFAKKMHLRIIESKVNVGSATTVNVQSRLAVADTLFVGGIQFRNVVFLVLPDEKLSFPQAKLVINGIIGFPVLYQMGEVHMYREGKIMVKKEPAKKPLHNLFLDDLVPVMAACTNTDTLLFNLDTGAKTSELSGKYYQAHKRFVEKNGKKES